MNKLMFAAAGVAVAGSAFSAPLVYDYKASVKYMDLKVVSASYTSAVGVKIKLSQVYQKVQKSASLRGYLVVDTDGATSQRIVAQNIANGSTTDLNVNAADTIVRDYGRNRAFLVVYNPNATVAKNMNASLRRPKILPAVLDAKWIDTKFKTGGQGARVPSSGIAEGYLYAGGELIQQASGTSGAVRPALDLLDLNNPAVTEATDGAGTTPFMAALGSIGDYGWTSVYLFGGWNGPQWQNLWPAAQDAIDAVQLSDFSIGNVRNGGYAAVYAPGTQRAFFHDTWMNAAGFGKYVADPDVVCCGLTSGDGAVLDSLNGSVKGGLFLCSENGFEDDTNYRWFNALGINGLEPWEDQFFTARLTPAVTFAGDYDQTDLWQDGDLELNTTDVISGTWSIKRNKTFNDRRANAWTPAEITRLCSANTTAPAAFTESAFGLADLCAAIKGAAFALNSATQFVPNNADGATGNGEIWRMTQNNRWVVPFITPRFVKAYGLGNWN